MTESFMYLSEKRGTTQSLSHRSYHLFNFGSYQRDHRKPFKTLEALNDETLVPGASLCYAVPGNRLIFLLPVIGRLCYKVDADATELTEVGQSVLLFFKEASNLTIVNPYKDEHINFIAGWIFYNGNDIQPVLTRTFDLEAHKNSFVDLLTVPDINVRLGKFSGHKDVSLRLRNTTGAAFAFVLEGTFEVQNRLLQQKDGLSIVDVSALEFEALSDNALLMIFEW